MGGVCVKLRGARLACNAAHCAKWSRAEFCATFKYMRCFAKRSGAKYGRAKCNEWTAYTVLGESNGVIAEWECNVPLAYIFLSFSSIIISRVALLLNAKQNFSVLGGGQRGSRGECP